MGLVRMEVNKKGGGYADFTKIDATTDDEIGRQMVEDNSDPQNFTKRFLPDEIRQLRERLALSQKEFAKRIDVPVQTVRNWEQGKRFPAGPARTLIKLLVREPEIVARLAD